MTKRLRIKWGIREKLTLLFFSVTIIAVVANFLMVVPRLEERLRGDRVRSVKRSAEILSTDIQNIVTSSGPPVLAPAYWTSYLTNVSNSTGNRVAMLQVEFDAEGRSVVKHFVDPTNLGNEVSAKADRVANRALRESRLTSGVVELANGLNAEAATPVMLNGQPVGVVVHSTSLLNVTSIVEQQARRNLVAGIFALSISLVAGLFAARMIAGRVKRLERAARVVAGGSFTEPLPVGSKDELDELARAFNNMQERLERADRARKAFIANASHELRTPLFSLGGYVELMREEDLDEATQREFLDTMHDQIRRMTKLATDLLDLSRIDAGSLEIQPEHVDLEELTRGVAREFDPVAVQHDSKIEVHSDGDSRAFCDSDRVAQIVRILIDNALSHTPPGTDVTVTTERENEQVHICVSDNGPGISEEDLPRLFDRFHTGNKSGGTGLGLSIADELATAMNSRLQVRSVPGNTTFGIYLPSEEADR